MSKADTFKESKEDRVSETLIGEENFSRTGSSFGAYFNVVCVVAGSGTLGIPYAFKQGGWISIGFLILSAMMSIYTGKLLMECLYYKPGERLHSYPEIGEAAFGKPGRFLVQLFHYSTLLGVSCLYLVLIGENAHSTSKQIKGIVLDHEIWISMGAALVLLPFLFLRTLKEVAWLSTFGALATLVVVIVSITLSLIDLNNNPTSTGVDLWENINWKEIPLSLATIGFSFGGNVVYPHVESSMKAPKNWTKVLTAAMATICAMYGAIGIVGYYVYGNLVQAPIMKSLPQGVGNLLATIFITVHIILVIPIALCSFSLEVEAKFNIVKSDFKSTLLRTGLRLATLGILTLIAASLPYFPELMSLIGALSNCAVVFVIPIVCHLRLYGWRKRPILEYLWIVLVLCVAFLGCILGAIQAVMGLVDKIKEDSNKK